jgi:hypothetical protein
MRIGMVPYLAFLAHKTGRVAASRAAREQTQVA